MQMLKLILLIALASSTLCDVSDPNSMIYKVMKTLAAQIPGMKIELGKPEKYPNEAIRKIIITAARVKMTDKKICTKSYSL